MILFGDWICSSYHIRVAFALLICEGVGICWEISVDDVFIVFLVS